MLTGAQIDAFLADGFVAVRGPDAPPPVEQAILDGLAQAGIGADEYRQPEPSART